MHIKHNAYKIMKSATVHLFWYIFVLYNYYFHFLSTYVFWVSLKVTKNILIYLNWDIKAVTRWHSNLSPSCFRNRWFRPRQFFLSGGLSVLWASLCGGGVQRSSGEDVHTQHLPTGTMNDLVNLVLRIYMHLANITCNRAGFYYSVLLYQIEFIPSITTIRIRLIKKKNIVKLQLFSRYLVQYFVRFFFNFLERQNKFFIFNLIQIPF